MTQDWKSTKSRQHREPRHPTFIAYHVSERRKKSFWTRIGAAWEHEDEKGLTLQLDLMPITEGRILLRAPPETETEQEEGEEKGA